MEKIKRSIFFWALVMLFFIAAPMIILNSIGYQFDSSRKVFVHSGSITFKSNPQIADANLDGNLINNQKLNRINSSFNISGLLPGTYDLSITAKDFKPWSKKIEVHSGLSTEFWNVVLTRETYDRNEIDLSGIQSFYVSPANQFIAFAYERESVRSVGIYNLDSRSDVASFELGGRAFSGRDIDENIEWSPDESYISIPTKEQIADEIPAQKNRFGKVIVPAKTESREETDYFIADLQSGTKFSLKEFFSKSDIRKVRWDPKEKGYLFFLDSGSLFRGNIHNNQDIAEIASDVSAFDASKDVIYYVQKPANLLYSVNPDGSSKKQITSLFPGENENIKKIIVYDEDRSGFISDDGDLYIYNNGEHDNYFRKIGSAIEGMYFSDDGKKLLYWSDIEIFAYFLRDWQVQPVRAEDEVQSITRYQEKVRNVQWFKDYEHIIFSTDRYIKLIELDPRDKRNTADILSTDISSSHIVYNKSFEKLYFTDSKNGINILNYILFPEKIGLLGIGG
jgi:hypothetical protein